MERNSRKATFAATDVWQKRRVFCFPENSWNRHRIKLSCIYSPKLRKSRVTCIRSNLFVSVHTYTICCNERLTCKIKQEPVLIEVVCHVTLSALAGDWNRQEITLPRFIIEWNSASIESIPLLTLCHFWKSQKQARFAIYLDWKFEFRALFENSQSTGRNLA